MSQLPRLSIALLFVAGLLVSSQANAAWWHHADGATNTLVDALEDDGRFGTLLFALDATGLDAALAGDDDLTVFAPTDAAFAALPPGTVEALVADPDALANVLLYHVVGGKQPLWRVLRNTTTETLQGNPILALRGVDGPTINGQTIASANQRAGNGLYHAIDGVLLPPANDVDVQSLVDVLALDGRFGTLIAAVTAAGLAGTLTTDGPFTVFAPTDDAFAALPAGTVEALLADPSGALTDILLYHVVAGRQTSLGLYFAQTVATLNGASVSVAYENGTLHINDSAVINYNANAPNGIVHVIDKVLIPGDAPESLVSILEADGRFTTLLAALGATGLDEVLATGGPFTVFAPTDDAFAALPPGTVEALLGDLDALTDILLYHVVDGRRGALSLLWERNVETLQGSDVNVRVKWWRVRVNGAKVTRANVQAPNGLIHVINAVLIP